MRPVTMKFFASGEKGGKRKIYNIASDFDTLEGRLIARKSRVRDWLEIEALKTEVNSALGKKIQRSTKGWRNWQGR